MIVGYARTSNQEQDLNRQIATLEKASCDKIFTDNASNLTSLTRGLDDAIKYLRDGDTLVVCRFDRVGHSLKNLVDLVKGLNQRNVGFRSLHEKIDTNSSDGNMINHIFGVLSEFEHVILRERAKSVVEPQAVATTPYVNGGNTVISFSNWHGVNTHLPKNLSKNRLESNTKHDQTRIDNSLGDESSQQLVATSIESTVKKNTSFS